MIAGFVARRPRPARPEGAQDLRLRPAAAGLPRLQRADQAALRPRRRDHGELRARPLRHLPARPRARRAIKAVARDMARELGAGNAYPDLLEKLAQFEVALTKFMEANLGRLALRRLRQQVLAGLRDVLRLRALLRQLAPGGARHPGRLRGGHLRRAERVHGHVRDRAPGHAARHQQHGARRTCIEAAGKKVGGIQARPTCSWASTAATRPPLPHRRRAEVPAHHAPPDGAGEGARHHARDARRADPAGRDHHLPPAGRRPTRSCARTSPRARSSTSTRNPSAGSASSRSRRWGASTATC